MAAGRLITQQIHMTGERLKDNKSVMKKWYVYIVECSDKSWYTGICRNIERRLKQHNGVLRGGAKYTRGRRPVRCVFIEETDTRSNAAKLEYRYRRLQRSEKKNLIERNLHQTNNILMGQK